MIQKPQASFIVSSGAQFFKKLRCNAAPNHFVDINKIVSAFLIYTIAYSMFTQGADGAMRSCWILMKGAGANGYIS